MKIANVSSVSLKNNKKTRQNQTSHSKDLTSFGNSSTTDSVTSKQAADAIKSNFLNNVSFKGQTEEINYKSIGTSGQVSITTKNDPYNSEPFIVDSYSLSISPERHKLLHSNSSIERTQNQNGYRTERVYFADPLEYVNDQTKRDHDYIIYDNKPSQYSLDEIRKAYSENSYYQAESLEKNIKETAEYFHRLEYADRKELKKLQASLREIEDSAEYKYDLENKINTFPWESEQLKQDKEKADYFDSINSNKRQDIQEKIAYYSERIDESIKKQHIAIQVFNIITEAEIVRKEQLANEVIHTRDYIRRDTDELAKVEKRIQEYSLELDNYNSEIQAITTLIDFNNKRIKKYEDTRAVNQVRELQTENQSFEKRLSGLRCGKNNYENSLKDYKEKRDNYITNIKNNKAKLPVIEKELEEKNKKAKELYPKMEAFYRQHAV